MLRFDCDGSCYKTSLRYKKNYIRAICDTGATMSSLDIYTLSKLTGFSPQAIYNQAESWLKRGKKCYGMSTASGKFDRTINIKLKNVIIDDTFFESFYARLNVDSELWKTDGKIEYDAGEIVLQPIVLIGLDVIRACNIHGDGEKIELHKFNYAQYINYCSMMYQDSLILYKNESLNAGLVDMEDTSVDCDNSNEDVLQIVDKHGKELTDDEIAKELEH